MINKLRQKGFTLIELLIVIAILGVIAVIALLALNPAEAQKKARDAQRQKDMTTIQAVIEQYLSDNPSATLVNVNSSTSGGGSKVCGTGGWLSQMVAGGVDLCSYANILNTDPSNKTSTNIISSTGTTVSGKDLVYNVTFSGQFYSICMHFESKSNASKINDQGGQGNWFKVSNGGSSAPACP